MHTWISATIIPRLFLKKMVRFIILKHFLLVQKCFSICSYEYFQRLPIWRLKVYSQQKLYQQIKKNLTSWFMQSLKSIYLMFFFPLFLRIDPLVFWRIYLFLDESLILPGFVHFLKKILKRNTITVFDFLNSMISLLSPRNL